jgi:hypothetical protein
MTAPVCNTGVHPPIEGAPFADASRFDWYRATVPAHPQLIVDACLEMAGEGAFAVEGKGRFNYLRSTTVEVAGDRVATILHGGSNGHPNVEASGDRAPALADLVRRHGPHRVTRADVAIDLYGDRAFRDLEGLALRIADKHGLTMRKIANPRDETAGETVYLGSRHSVVFARVYEKGKADAGRYGDVEPAVLHRWVRCEIEVKPQKDMKAVAATLAPHEFWGISAWTQQLAEDAFNMAPDPIPFHPRRTASDDRAFRFMCDQYRNLLRRRVEHLHGGDRMALAREILSAIYDDEAQHAA